MKLMKFVRNHRDLSTRKGFQFEFRCDRCGSGFRTPFQPSATGVVNDVLNIASGLLGGVLRKASSVGRQVHSAGWEQSHDRAFNKAVTQARPNFQQCPRCSKWVCKEGCWNTQRGLCKTCTPDTEAARLEIQIVNGIEDESNEISKKSTCPEHPKRAAV